MNYLKLIHYSLYAIAVISALALLSSCGAFLGPTEQETALSIADNLLLNGTISQEQYEALVTSLTTTLSNQYDWETIIWAVAVPVASYFGVQLFPPKRAIQREVMKQIPPTSPPPVVARA